jgi:hypothetical protein
LRSTLLHLLSALSLCCRRLEPFVCRGPLQPDNCCGKSITRTYGFLRSGSRCCPRILLRLRPLLSRAFLMYERCSIGIGVENCLTCSENGTAQPSYGTTSRYMSQEHCGKTLRPSPFILTVPSATRLAERKMPFSAYCQAVARLGNFLWVLSGFPVADALPLPPLQTDRHSGITRGLFPSHGLLLPNPVR